MSRRPSSVRSKKSVVLSSVVPDSDTPEDQAVEGRGSQLELPGSSSPSSSWRASNLSATAPSILSGRPSHLSPPEAEGDVSRDDLAAGRQPSFKPKISEIAKQRVKAFAQASATTAFGRTLSVEEEEDGEVQKRNGEHKDRKVFVDACEMKQKVREAIHRPKWNVADLYNEKGCWQKIARSPYFDNFTLVVISLNAVWIWIEVDYNPHELISDADWQFQLGANLFCGFFFTEWLIRFMSFRHKTDCVKDAWLMFDTVLLILMVLETWLTPLIIYLTSGSLSPGQGLAGTSVMRVLRMLRLSRMARMVRLLRAMPELKILVKGMATAMRSVFFTLCLMVVIIYVYALAFRQLTSGDDGAQGIGETYFRNVPESMLTLLVYGTLLDEVSQLVYDVRQSHSSYLLFLLLSFILLAALTVMNMLVGVLCEVVNAVAAVEKEELLVGSVHAKLMSIVNQTLTASEIRKKGSDHEVLLSRNQFDKILEIPAAVRALQEVGVDVVGLVDYTDLIFPVGTNPDEANLSFRDFMDVVLQLRGTNTATVKDVVDLRKALTLYLDNKEKVMSDSLEKILSKAWSKFAHKPERNEMRASTTGGILMNDDTFTMSRPPPPKATFEEQGPEETCTVVDIGLKRDEKEKATLQSEVWQAKDRWMDESVPAKASLKGEALHRLSAASFAGDGQRRSIEMMDIPDLPRRLTTAGVLATLEDLKLVQTSFLEGLQQQTEYLQDLIDNAMRRNMQALLPLLEIGIAASASAPAQSESPGETGGTAPPADDGAGGSGGATPMFPAGAFQHLLAQAPPTTNSARSSLAGAARRSYRTCDPTAIGDKSSRLEEVVAHGVDELQRIDQVFRAALHEFHKATRSAPAFGSAGHGPVQVQQLEQQCLEQQQQQTFLVQARQLAQSSRSPDPARQSITPVDAMLGAERLPVLVQPKYRPPEGPPPTPPPTTAAEAVEALPSQTPPPMETGLRQNNDPLFAAHVPVANVDAHGEDSLMMDEGHSAAGMVAPEDGNASVAGPARPSSRVGQGRPQTPEPASTSRPGSRLVQDASRSPSPTRKTLALPEASSPRLGRCLDLGSTDAQDVVLLRPDSRRDNYSRPESRLDNHSRPASRMDSSPSQRDTRPDRPDSRFEHYVCNEQDVPLWRPDSRAEYSAPSATSSPVHRPASSPAEQCGHLVEDVSQRRPDSRHDDYARPESRIGNYSRPESVVESAPRRNSYPDRPDSRFEQYVANEQDVPMSRADSCADHDAPIAENIVVLTKAGTMDRCPSRAPDLAPVRSSNHPDHTVVPVTRPDSRFEQAHDSRSVRSDSRLDDIQEETHHTPPRRPSSRVDQMHRPESRMDQHRSVTPEARSQFQAVPAQNGSDSSWFSPAPLAQTVRPRPRSSRSHPKPRFGDAIPLEEAN